MPRYVIERDIPEIGSAEREAFVRLRISQIQCLQKCVRRKRTFNGSTPMLRATRHFAFILLTTRR